MTKQTTYLSPRWRYLLRSIKSHFSTDRFSCPNCRSAHSDHIKRKYLVTKLVRCKTCHVLYRTPTDPINHNSNFHQDDYNSGFTTDCPDDYTLNSLIKNHFHDSPKNFTHIISILESLGVNKNHRIFDFGSSWGYATWQFMKSGFETVGYEICKSRARYAREKLQVDVFDNLEAIHGKFDVFFSSHVLEHLTAPQEAFNIAESLLNNGGLFVAITPNGSIERMNKNPKSYHRSWGLVHPFYLDEVFYQYTFKNRPKLICSAPYNTEQIRQWDQKADLSLRLDGSELLFVTKL